MTSLKQKIEHSHSLFLGGVHDVLSAKIVRKCRYDGAWLSGLGVSVAKRGVPDASIVTFTELAEVCRNITYACDIPVVVDMDSGYGNLVNAFYYAKELMQSGAQGLCIEDNVYPKCNSFFEKEGKLLAPISEMQAKIEAIKSAVPKGFLVIARNEGLIIGLPLDQVFLRSEAYLTAGADAVVIHTKNWHKLKEYLGSCKEEKPLAVIPTKIPEMPQEELQRHFKIIIYTNQALRAGITAAENMMEKIRSLFGNVKLQELSPGWLSCFWMWY